MRSNGSCVWIVTLLAGLLVSSALAQPDWEQKATTGPSARQDAAMAYYPPSGTMVLFGGHTGNWVALSDTWEWDGSGWTQEFPAHPPPGRMGAAMAYDADRQEMVLFGGRNNGDRDNTYVWDGTDWAEVFPAHRPPARMQHTMTYNAVRQRVVMFAGCDGYDPGEHFADTWEWDGTDWTQVAAGGPPARRLHGMTYHADSDKTIVFGGFYAGTKFNDTWEWDGSSWTEAFPAHSPSQRYGHGMSYHAIRATAVIYCGSGGANQTWEWDGSDWTQVVTAHNPGYRMYHGMAYDPVRRATVLFGGWGGDMEGDTWEFSGGEPECPGDIDGDGDTDHSDLGELLAAWCTHEGDPNWNPDADLDGDGHIGHGDLGILLADWGCGT